MSLADAKTVFEIGKLAADIYGIWHDKKRDRENDEKERRIRELEERIAKLERNK